MSDERLFLIDAHALCYRSFFAIKGLVNSRGQATNAVYGFVAALKKILRNYNPEYIAVCFDRKGKTFRQEKYAQYKIHRPQMPDELISQIPLIRDVIQAYKIPILECEGYEADDVIATLVKRVKRQGLEIVLVSDDKDLFQLLGPGVKVLQSKAEEILGEKQIQENIGFAPQQIVDFIALAGDSADHIPGIKGIGETTAKKLLDEYGSLKEIYKNTERIKPERIRKMLCDQEQSAWMSQDLAQLAYDVPLEIKLEDMRKQREDSGKLHEIFTDLEFRKFAQELRPVTIKATETKTAVQINEFKELQVLSGRVEKASQVAIWCDVPDSEEMLPGGHLWLWFAKDEIFQLPKELKGLGEFIQNLWSMPKLVKIVYDVKGQFRNSSWKTPDHGQGLFDVMLAGYLAEPSQGAYDVPSLVWKYLKQTVVDNPGPGQYLGYLVQLREILTLILEKRGLTQLFKDLEMPLALVLLRMEQEGVCIDLALLEELSKSSSQKIAGLVKQIHNLAGQEFNLNSPKQLSEILFVKLKLPVVKKTKTGFSTDEGVLVKLASAHELPALLLEYRQLTKIKSTYIDVLPKLVSRKTSRLHTHFNQCVAETGRLSSHNPNLQNIPIRTDFGRQIRSAFIPSTKNRKIISADYSQIELRILAHLSGDENLIQVFQRGEDIHTYTAHQILDVEQSQVTEEMRYRAKRVNFGIIYGMSAFGLAADLKISQKDAQDFIDQYFMRYPKVREFMDQEIALCKRQGFVTTLLNRRRYIPDINNSNIGVRQFAERQAINTPVQGSAADIIKLAMIRIDEDLRTRGFQSRMIITVHDELVFDAVQQEEPQLIALVKDHMEHAVTLNVPIVVSIKHGKNWLETERI